MNAKHQTIRKSISIQAPRQTVWNVLLQDKFTRIWYAEFSPGSQADTDWVVGSKARFTDNSGEGVVGQVIVNKPAEVLSVEFDGIIKNGREDYESTAAERVKGSRETYWLSGSNGITHLSIESDMVPEYFDALSLAWDRAVQKIKALAEESIHATTLST